MTAIVRPFGSVSPTQTPRRRPALMAGAALAAIIATIAGALAFQAAGIAPCHLCLEERIPYYAGIALAAATLAAALYAPRSVGVVCFALLALLFLFSAGFGAYHAGVEWGVWPGPADCTGGTPRAADSADFLRQLQTVRVVRCDAVAIRVLGLSLAGWNVVASLVIAALAMGGMTRFRDG